MNNSPMKKIVLLLFLSLSMTLSAQNEPLFSATPLPSSFLGLHFGMDQASVMKKLIKEYRINAVEGGMDISKDDGKIYFQGFPYDKVRLMFSDSDKLVMASFFVIADKATSLKNYALIKDHFATKYRLDCKKEGNFERSFCADYSMTSMLLSVGVDDDAAYFCNLMLLRMMY